MCACYLKYLKSVNIGQKIILLVKKMGADNTDLNCICCNLFLMNGCVLAHFCVIGKITKKVTLEI